MSSPPWHQLIGDHFFGNPEMATLHILGGVLSVAQRVLLCAHPQLEGVNAVPSSELSALATLADSMLTHIAGLQSALQRYPQELRRHYQRLLHEEREIPF